MMPPNPAAFSLRQRGTSLMIMSVAPDFGPVGGARPGKRKESGPMRKTGARAFTLVELMVVVSIIALLVALVTPTLGRARALARKALCATQLKAFAGAIQSYVAAQRTYPRMGGDGVWNPPYSKIYTVMELSGITAGGRNIKGWQYYDNITYDEVWKGALCPEMDPAPIWTAAAQGQPMVPQCKPDYAIAGVGYQWNVTLRGRERTKPRVPLGRYPANPIYGGANWRDLAPYWNNDWITGFIELKDGNLYLAQATHPEEIENPSACAEAWDGMDIDSVPKEAYWGSSSSDWDACDYEDLVPGWSVGPQTIGANGWALLPADRHPGGSPNILYADGTVRADATRRITLQDIPGIAARLGANKDTHLISWDDYEPQLYGTIPHLLPKRKVIPPPW